MERGREAVVGGGGECALLHIVSTAAAAAAGAAVEDWRDVGPREGLRSREEERGVVLRTEMMRCECISSCFSFSSSFPLAFCFPSFLCLSNHAID